MLTFSAWRLTSDGLDVPMVVGRRSGYKTRTPKSQATWASVMRRRVSVTLWLSPTGEVGEGPAPAGCRALRGGYDHQVSRVEAAHLAAAGWAHCIARAA